MNYQPVIGLEVHVELNTKSKMFCSCSANYFEQQPNSQTCPVCLGLPGALPYINREAIRKCLMIGLALGCQVPKVSRFERKNYFYPDLPKGYQISQYRWPLCIGGSIEVSGKNIRINRVHQEEDTGKLMHRNGQSVIDFNRSGVPLAEIVTEPDFDSPEQVREFAKKLQQLFRYLGVSGAEMEKGQIRLEANVSLRGLKNQKSKVETEELPNYRIELKNINSFSFMVKAINYEIRRQSEELEKGVRLTQQTRGWDEIKGMTVVHREKEEAHDYRYFPEPDLPDIRYPMSDVRQIQVEMPELPWEAQERLVKELGVAPADALLLTEKGELTSYFEEAAKLALSQQLTPKDVANELIHHKMDITKVTPVELVNQLVQRRSSVISDERVIERWVREVIEENPRIVADYRDGKESALQALIGAVMRKSQRKANSTKVTELLISKL